MHKAIVQITDVILFLAGIVIILMALQAGTIFAIGAIAGICLTLSIWSAIRCIVDNTETTKNVTLAMLQQLKDNNV